MTVLLGQAGEHGLGTGEERPQFLDALDVRVAGELGID